ncbi:U32 family peptidase C-terminal domain-containing protein, partial [Pediococcus acidilactici]
TVTEMKNDEGESIDRAPNPMMVLTMPVAQPVKPGDMIRKKKD